MQCYTFLIRLELHFKDGRYKPKKENILCLTLIRFSQSIAIINYYYLALRFMLVLMLIHGISYGFTLESQIVYLI